MKITYEKYKPGGATGDEVGEVAVERREEMSAFFGPDLLPNSDEERERKKKTKEKKEGKGAKKEEEPAIRVDPQLYQADVPEGTEGAVLSDDKAHDTAWTPNQETTSPTAVSDHFEHEWKARRYNVDTGESRIDSRDDEVKCTLQGPPTEFSEEEKTAFETGFKDNYKNFRVINRMFLPSRTHGELVNYYYQWKRTPRFNEFYEQLAQRREQRKDQKDEEEDNFLPPRSKRVTGSSTYRATSAARRVGPDALFGETVSGRNEVPSTSAGGMSGRKALLALEGAPSTSRGRKPRPVKKEVEEMSETPTGRAVVVKQEEGETGRRKGKRADKVEEVDEMTGTPNGRSAVERAESSAPQSRRRKKSEEREVKKEEVDKKVEVFGTVIGPYEELKIFPKEKLKIIGGMKWWKVVSESDSTIGFVPADFVRREFVKAKAKGTIKGMTGGREGAPRRNETMPAGEYVIIVERDYKSQGRQQLDIKSGERLKMKNETWEWWEVTRESGEVEFVPTHYVRVRKSTSKQMARGGVEGKRKDVKPQQPLPPLDTLAHGNSPSLPPMDQAGFKIHRGQNRNFDSGVQTMVHSQTQSLMSIHPSESGMMSGMTGDLNRHDLTDAQRSQEDESERLQREADGFCGPSTSTATPPYPPEEEERRRRLLESDGRHPGNLPPTQGMPLDPRCLRDSHVVPQDKKN